MASASAFTPSSLSIDAGAMRLTLSSLRGPRRPLSTRDNNSTRHYANGMGGFDLFSKMKKSVSISSSAPASTKKNGVVNISKKKAPSTKVASSPPNKKSIIKVNVINKNLGKVGAKNNVKQVELSSPTQTPWSRIFLSFLIPWRNPNSIFLYMLLAVSVLGKLNEHPH